MNDSDVPKRVREILCGGASKARESGDRHQAALLMMAVREIDRLSRLVLAPVDAHRAILNERHRGEIGDAAERIRKRVAYSLAATGFDEPPDDTPLADICFLLSSLRASLDEVSRLTPDPELVNILATGIASEDELESLGLAEGRGAGRG